MASSDLWELFDFENSVPIGENDLLSSSTIITQNTSAICPDTLVDLIPRKYTDKPSGDLLTITKTNGTVLHCRKYRPTRDERLTLRKDSVHGSVMRAILTPADDIVKRHQKYLDQHSTCGDQLWIQKYTPKKFSDLVTYDQTNKEVLQYLLDWKEKTLDATKPFLLLYGRSGSGKSALIRIAAESLNYAPLVIGVASGEDSLAGRIATALSTDAIGGNLRLVVLEELDAVPVDTCASLISLLIKSGSKRPIAILCSDPWVFTLKSLRPFCKIVQVLVSPKRFSERLEEILQLEYLEGIQLQESIQVQQKEIGTPCHHGPGRRVLLEKLVKISNGDIREAIYSLQFHRGDVSKAISALSNISCTPSTNLFFKTMEDIFLTRHRVSVIGVGLDSNGNEAELIACALFKRLDLLGDHLDRVFEGAFESYLKCATLGSTVELGELIAYKDHYDFRTHGKSADLSLLPSILLSFYHSFGGGLSVRLNGALKNNLISLPKESFEAREAMVERKKLVRNWIYSTQQKACIANAGLLVAGYAAIQSIFNYEILPYLVRLITPSTSLINCHTHQSAGSNLVLIDLVEKLHIYRLSLEWNNDGIVQIPQFKREVSIGLSANAVGVNFFSVVAKMMQDLEIKQRSRLLKREGQSIREESESPTNKKPASKRPVSVVKRDFFGRVVFTEDENLPLQKGAAHSLLFRYQEKAAHSVRRKISILNLIFKLRTQ